MTAQKRIVVEISHEAGPTAKTFDEDVLNIARYFEQIARDWMSESWPHLGTTVTFSVTEPDETHHELVDPNTTLAGVPPLSELFESGPVNADATPPDLDLARDLERFQAKKANDAVPELGN